MNNVTKPNKKTIAAIEEARTMNAQTFMEDFFIDGKKCHEDANKSKPKKVKERKSTNKLDKETFIIVMNLIIEQDKMSEKLDNALQLINSSWTINELDTHTRKALYKMLEIFFSDMEMDNIFWYCYEDVPKIIYELDKKTGKHSIEHHIKSFGDLYNYIMGGRKK